MSKCKVKIKVDVCGESALDQVTTLVVNDKMEIKAACVKVAEEFNATNDGATVKWDTLRKAYTRANKVDRGTCPTKNTKERGTCPTEPKKLDVPIVADQTLEIDKLKKDLAAARKAVNTMVLAKNTQRAEGVVQPTTTTPPSFAPPKADSNKVMVDIEELAELAACQAQLLLLKDDLKAMRSILTDEQRLRYDSKDQAKDTTFETELSTRRKVTEMVKAHQAT